MRRLLNDLRYATRSLIRQPVVAITAVMSLALGIGANTTIFTLVNAVLLDPVPAVDLDRLVSVYTVDKRLAGGSRGSHHPTSVPNFEDLRNENQVFSHLAAFFSTPLAFSHGTPEEVTGQLVSTDFFAALGLRAAQGRFFTEEENGPQSAQPVVVVSHTFWRTRLGGESAIVGQEIRLNGRAFEVVGVAPAGFLGPRLSQTPDLWVPLMLHDQLLTGAVKRFFPHRRALFLGLIGRLDDGVSVARAESAMATHARDLAERYPEVNRERTITVVPLAESNLRPDQRALFSRAGTVLLVAVALILTIVCLNVAHLLLVRAERRRTEIALRLALGASRGVLLRQLLAEGVVLATAGAALGLAGARWARDVLWDLRPPMLANAEPDLGFDTNVLAFTAAVAVGTALIAGLAPVLGALRVDLQSVLRSSQPVAGQSRMWTARGFLVVVQIALSMVALTVSGLFLKSLARASAAETGFAHRELGVLAYNLGTLSYDADRGLGFHRRVLETATAQPGVERAALATNRPLNPLFGGIMRTLVPEGLDASDPANGLLASTNIVSAGYFETLGIPLLTGRGFDGGDRAEARNVAVVNETLAKTRWPDRDALGQRFSVRGVEGMVEVVGIARDSLYQRVGQPAVPYLFLPLEQNYNGRAHLFVRSAGSPARAIAGVRGSIRQIDEQLPLTHLTTMADELAASLWALRLGALLMGGFGVLAMVSACIGVWGIMAYVVGLRRQELGLRAALGARPVAVFRMVLVRGLVWAAVGVVLGGFLTTFLSGLLGRLLYGVQVIDPVTFATTGAILVTVAAAANLGPAWGASAADPMRVLRRE